MIFYQADNAHIVNDNDVWSKIHVGLIKNILQT